MVHSNIWIETLPRRGYRYVGPPVARANEAAPSSVLPVPERPSIAVLPFSNLSGGTEQEYFVYGMVDDIITGLSRINWLFVIARNSSFVYNGRNVDVKQVGRELGVRYVLEGSARKLLDRVRITDQLIDASTGAHVWAERYERRSDDIFALQDEIALSVVGAIGLDPAYALAHGNAAMCHHRLFLRAGLQESDRTLRSATRDRPSSMDRTTRSPSLGRDFPSPWMDTTARPRSWHWKPRSPSARHRR